MLRLWPAEGAIMTNGLPLFVFLLLLAGGGWAAYSAYATQSYSLGATVMVATILIAAVVASSIKIAAQWSRAVVLRLGKFHSLSGPGLFFIIPVVDTVVYWIDTRVITTTFRAEKTLTKDTVPVDVDAVLFWKVVDPEKAALDVADYENAVAWASQTSLRDVIGKTMLADTLEGRRKISDEIRGLIDELAKPWGIDVQSVEIRDVLIPAALQDAMSMQAQAERERQARVILGDSERQVADSFLQAAKTYASDPNAFHLRAMNMLYEGLKRNATIVVVPSTAVESMQLGGVAGLTALTTQLADKQRAAAADNPPAGDA
jgi:regulator of protease activity HflC (stomatin/prohibitin superfamily)